MTGSLETVWSSTRPGSLVGLSVVLNIQQSVYMRSPVQHARDQRSGQRFSLLVTLVKLVKMTVKL